MAASVQDRDGARRLLLRTGLAHATVRKIWGDQGFADRLVDWAAALKRTVEIVRKEPGRRGFQVQPKRWAVERAAASASRSPPVPRAPRESPFRQLARMPWCVQPPPPRSCA